MKTFVAIVLGFFSGSLVTMMVLMLVGPEPVGTLISGAIFFGSYGLSTYAFINGAETVSKVFSRGFLVGAAEWLFMIVAGVVFSGRVLASASPQDGAGAAIGAGLVAITTGGFALVMVVVCLAGFAVSHFMGKEMRPAGPTVLCPECAEVIQKAARKCKHCGTEILSAE